MGGKERRSPDFLPLFSTHSKEIPTMKNIKKILSLLMALALCACIAAVSASAKGFGEGQKKQVPGTGSAAARSEAGRKESTGSGSEKDHRTNSEEEWKEGSGSEAEREKSSGSRSKEIRQNRIYIKKQLSTMDSCFFCRGSYEKYSGLFCAKVSIRSSTLALS